MGCPTTVDRNCSAGDRYSTVTAEEDCQCSDLFDIGKTLIGLFLQQNVLDNAVTWDFVGLGLVFDLVFDQRCPYIAWTNGIAGDTGFSPLKRYHFGETNHPMFGRNIGCLEWRS